MSVDSNNSTVKRVIVVGGVAGGMSTATRLRRLDESVEIMVIEKSGHVSYANCGLPYYVGGVIQEESDLLLQTPERLHDRFRLDVRVNTEVIGIDATAHEVTVRDAISGTDSKIGYDKLVLSPVRFRCDLQFQGLTVFACCARSKMPLDCTPMLQHHLPPQL